MLHTPDEHQNNRISLAKKSHLAAPERGREGPNLDKVAHAICLPFSPRLTRAAVKLDRFEDLDVNRISAMFAGLILDVDGTLTSHHSQEFSEPVIQKLIEIRKKMLVCIYSNNIEDRRVIRELGIPVARHVPPKPAPEGFRVIPALYLQGTDPHRCAMVGDNYLTDGGCRRIGMPFIKVKPIPGPEKFFHRLTRAYGDKVADLHDLFRKR